MKLIKKVNLFSDFTIYETYKGNSGFVELWDFSKANMSHKNRVLAVSKVASVCYGNEPLNPKYKLFDMLKKEALGLPNSSFEFIPVFLDQDKIDSITQSLGSTDIPNIFKFGHFVKTGLITNFRALSKDLISANLDPEDTMWFNTEEECDILKQEVFTFRSKITIRDARQLMRHRTASYQELSRRYTKGDKIPFEFRYTKKQLEVSPFWILEDMKRVKAYQGEIEMGIAPQVARDSLPVRLYTLVWHQWRKPPLDNFLAERTKPSAQREIRELAVEMKNLLL